MPFAAMLVSLLAGAFLATPAPTPRDSVHTRTFAQIAASIDPTGKELYEKACASCHGLDGKGVERSKVAFDIPLPDFTDCSFASREQDADWIAVAHEGGPARGFARTMPAFGEAFTDEQLGTIVSYLRTLCTNARWPRGELNLPRPMFTEKAYPEDEAVVTFGSHTEGPGRLTADFVYEKRIGILSQFEIKIPTEIHSVSGATTTHEGGVGDIELGLKRTLYHNLASGSIVAFGTDVALPTGKRRTGLGTGTVVVEPFVSLGKVIAGDGFIHVQTAAEFAADEKKAENELAFRTAFGWTFAHNRYGRLWTPMAEFIGARELESGRSMEWDVVPQFQVSLSTRQHVLANLGMRLPITERSGRSKQIVLYVLWDWFDGSLLHGW
jgi:mono/diheme cytochrome c family protein